MKICETAIIFVVVFEPFLCAASNSTILWYQTHVPASIYAVLDKQLRHALPHESTTFIELRSEHVRFPMYLRRLQRSDTHFPMYLRLLGHLKPHSHKYLRGFR